jgi:hypothetical protein
MFNLFLKNLDSVLEWGTGRGQELIVSFVALVPRGSLRKGSKTRIEYYDRINQ